MQPCANALLCPFAGRSSYFLSLTKERVGGAIHLRGRGEKNREERDALGSRYYAKEVFFVFVRGLSPPPTEMLPCSGFPAAVADMMARSEIDERLRA